MNRQELNKNNNIWTGHQRSHADDERAGVSGPVELKFLLRVKPSTWSILILASL